MIRFFLSFLVGVLVFAFAPAALADRVAVLPFRSTKNVPKPELDEARKWTKEAAVARGHTLPNEAEMALAESAVRDRVADTSNEFLAAGKASNAKWTVTANVERIDYPPAKLPDGTIEEGYTTYRIELEVGQVETGRVESLSREILPEDALNDVGEMIVLLLRPEGISHADIPWEQKGAKRPKPKPKPPAPPPPPPPPPKPPEPRAIYGEKFPLALGLSIGVTNALSRPDNARGPSWAMPIGGAAGYALEAVPGLELRGVVTSQVIGPRALEIAAGARYAYAPIRGVKLFAGPELLLGAHVALGADKVARFLGHGAAFVAYGIGDHVQLEIAADLAAAFGGAGTLVLGGGTFRTLVRF